MGIVFEHLDDIALIKDLFPGDTNVAYIDEDRYGEDEQVGKTISVNDGQYELIACHQTFLVDGIGGQKEQKTILWDVWTYDYDPGVRYYPDGSGQPPSWDDRQMGVGLTITEAVSCIITDMLKAQHSCVMENAYFENLHKEEELHPEEAWPQCMLDEDHEKV